MNRSDSGDSGASSGSRRRYRTPSPQPQDSIVTLAKIFITNEQERIKSEWNGTQPVVGDKLFVYAHIGNTTYSSYMPRSNGYSYNLDFTNMRAGPHGRAGASFLHCSNGSIILPLMHGAHHDITPLQRNCRIYHDKKNKIWYKLNKEGYEPDKEVSTNASTSRHGRHVPSNIPIDSIRNIHESNVGAHCSIGSDYTPLTEYITGKQLYLLNREITQTLTSGRSRSETPPRRGGGKTRRKFKVKKRRNRRIRNTMKRRKTAVKRRKGRK